MGYVCAVFQIILNYFFIFYMLVFATIIMNLRSSKFGNHIFTLWESVVVK